MTLADLCATAGNLTSVDSLVTTARASSYPMSPFAWRVLVFAYLRGRQGFVSPHHVDTHLETMSRAYAIEV
jgi:hypothetical protein